MVLEPEVQRGEIYHEGDKRGRGGGLVGVVVEAEQAEADNHPDTGELQQHLPNNCQISLGSRFDILHSDHLATQSVNEQIGDDRGGNVDDAQDDGGGVRGGGARGDEDGHGVKHHCIDPGELLEDHEESANS